MKLFEIHITGSSGLILKEFQQLNIKVLHISLLDGNHNNVGYEYMCCIQQKFESYEECLEFTLDLVSKLKSEIARVKIESPYYKEYLTKAVYAEVHFIPNTPCLLPTVFNIDSKKYVSTERVYDKSLFLKLREKYSQIDSEFELCLFDSSPQSDDFWLSHYKK